MKKSISVAAELSYSVIEVNLTRQWNKSCPGEVRLLGLSRSRSDQSNATFEDLVLTCFFLVKYLLRSQKINLENLILLQIVDAVLYINKISDCYYIWHTRQKHQMVFSCDFNFFFRKLSE